MSDRSSLSNTQVCSLMQYSAVQCSAARKGKDIMDHQPHTKETRLKEYTRITSQRETRPQRVMRQKEAPPRMFIVFVLLWMYRYRAVRSGEFVPRARRDSPTPSVSRPKFLLY
jgi:hypothetical protein